ncbi:hypothetical protein BJY04DRAFT_201300 [Aspergillus karnatakaensis]|uniref:uncharacterized protein n=1 Tax=Aspergillus karnatakaensis TaxID=1810916 RepID=UPI003CCCBCFD
MDLIVWILRCPFEDYVLQNTLCILTPSDGLTAHLDGRDLCVSYLAMIPASLGGLMLIIALLIIAYINVESCRRRPRQGPGPSSDRYLCMLSETL